MLMVSAAGTARPGLPENDFLFQIPVVQIVNHDSTPAVDDPSGSEMWNRLLKSGENILFSLIA